MRLSLNVIDTRFNGVVLYKGPSLINGKPIVVVATGLERGKPACDQGLRRYCMASVDTPAELALARRKGWKTFRVRNDDEPLEAHEFVCPASEEAGKRRQCETCLACCGGEWNGKTVTPVIRAHGMHWKPVRFRKMQRLMRQKKKFRQLLPSLIGTGASKGKGRTGTPSK